MVEISELEPARHGAPRSRLPTGGALNSIGRHEPKVRYKAEFKEKTVSPSTQFT